MVSATKACRLMLVTLLNQDERLIHDTTMLLIIAKNNYDPTRKRDQRAHFKDGSEAIEYSHDQLCLQIWIWYKGVQSELVTHGGLGVLA